MNARKGRAVNRLPLPNCPEADAPTIAFPSRLRPASAALPGSFLVFLFEVTLWKQRWPIRIWHDHHTRVFVARSSRFPRRCAMTDIARCPAIGSRARSKSCHPIELQRRIWRLPAPIHPHGCDVSSAAFAKIPMDHRLTLMSRANPDLNDARSGEAKPIAAMPKANWLAKT